MSLRKPTLLSLFLIVFIDLIGFGLMMPLLPYFARDFGASGAKVGWLLGIFSLMQFFFAPVWGQLSDRVGRRPVLLVSLAGSTFSYLLMAFAQSYLLLFLARMLAGICAANIAVANAYVSDITTKENRSKGMGVIGAAFGIGFVFGPILAALFGRHGHLVPSLIASGISATSFVLTLVHLPESLPVELRKADRLTLWRNPFTGWNEALSLPFIAPLAAIACFSNVAMAQWETTFALYLKEQPAFGYDIGTVGKLFAFVGLLSAMMQGGLLGRLVKRFGEGALLRAGLVGTALGTLLMPLAPGLGLLLCGLTLFGLALGAVRPVLSGTASLATSPEKQGLVLGVILASGSIGRIAGPLLGGWLFDHGRALPFFISGGIMLLLLPLSPRPALVSALKKI
ncbi:Predicted arabinose efflux permease, MFS family [Verrucomicrobium sp. GAS474]|uniref:MFS transporter n=1 Tax=Verrucomicrobium sp. GAS474 TaxID=1882831 RepID=UPI00087D44AF|nr:MFS transporter [Verrucomicrobium sp. GAS474]SDU17070.1 Predicted arabinose efflux permease, MFS family [Verrucomicrobium sp. GAS474]